MCCLGKQLGCKEEAEEKHQPFRILGVAKWRVKEGEKKGRWETQFTCYKWHTKAGRKKAAGQQTDLWRGFLVSMKPGSSEPTSQLLLQSHIPVSTIHSARTVLVWGFQGAGVHVTITTDHHVSTMQQEKGCTDLKEKFRWASTSPTRLRNVPVVLSGHKVVERALYYADENIIGIQFNTLPWFRQG